LRHDTSYVINDDPNDPLVEAAMDSGGEVVNAALLHHYCGTGGTGATGGQGERGG
jgi:hypothetical protein